MLILKREYMYCLFVNVTMRVCIYTRMYICIFCICKCVCMCIGIFILYMYVRVYECIFMFMHVCVYSRT